MDDAGAAVAAGRFLTFRSAGRLYALPADVIAEIIMLPPVARLPLSPAALLGMANLRGSVVAVASLRALLGHDAETAPATRAIVLDGATPVAIAVDAVENLVTLDRAEAAEQVLDIAALLARAFTLRKSAGAPQNTKRSAAGQDATQPVQSPRIALVTFDVAGQAYALPLDDVREIISMPADIAIVPHAEDLIAGVAAHRDALLPLLSLRGLLGFPIEADPRHKIIVTSVAGVLVGLIADRMRAIIHADPGRIEPAPPLLAARAGGEARIGSIYRGETGLVSLLATENLFSDAVMARLRDQPRPEPAKVAVPAALATRFLEFRLAGEAFALPLGAVDEVAEIPDKITRLPKLPDFLRGVVNLRGEVLPVIDLASRFGLAEHGGDAASQRLVVTRSAGLRAGLRAGLIVDAISGLLAATADAVGPAPLLAGEDRRLVRGVLNLPAPAKLVLILDADELLTRAELSLLQAARPPDCKRAAP